MSVLPWTAIFLAVPSLWPPTLRRLGVGLLCAGYGFGFANGQLGLLAAAPLLLLVAAAMLVAPHRTAHSRNLGHALFIALAVALCLHWLPGFHNPRVIGPLRFTPDAVPFAMYLNFDKPLIGFWLLLVLPWIRAGRDMRTTLANGLAGCLLASAACLSMAVALGLVAWEPKVPADSWLWLLNNLLLVTVTEEALFRGYVQGGLTRWLGKQRYGEAVALGAAALLFGLAHFSGGWQWMVLGSIAGVGYGLAYRHGGLPAAVIAHFGLNVLHVFLFSYPMLQQAGASLTGGA